METNEYVLFSQMAWANGVWSLSRMASPDIVWTGVWDDLLETAKSICKSVSCRILGESCTIMAEETVRFRQHSFSRGGDA